MRDRGKFRESFDAEVMGEWKIRLLWQKSHNKKEPLTEFADLKAGSVKFEVPLANIDRSAMRIIAEAQLVSPLPEYERTAISARPVFVSILRGNAIGADVTVNRLSGAAPFTSLFRLDLHDREDGRATGDVVWHVSDDNGVSWEAQPVNARYKIQLAKTFEQGSYKVRAEITNLNSGKTSFTDAVDVVAYAKPELAIEGPNTLFVGSEATYKAQVQYEGANTDTVIEWSDDRGKTYYSGPLQRTLQSDSSQRIPLYARARSISAPADDPYAWAHAKTMVDFRTMKAPRISFTGPKFIEIGKPSTFKAKVSPPYRGMELPVSGYFTLPDGSTVSGDTVEFTPDEIMADQGQGYVALSYTARIEGLNDQKAEATRSHRSRIWQYKWPNFRLEAKKTAKVAPADITLKVKTVGLRGQLDNPKYQWTLPDGATLKDGQAPSIRVFQINKAGTFPVNLVVSDAKGNTTRLEHIIELGKPDSFQVDLRYSSSNRAEREPLKVMLRPYISGGHPRDRIISRTFVVNEQTIEGSGLYGRAILDAGEHTVKAKIKSEMGYEAEGEITINVAENQLPTCDLKQRETIGSLILYAQCKDPDGRVKSYEWRVNGELQKTSSYKITLNKSRYETIEVSMIGVDDSGGKAEPVKIGS